MPLEATQYLAGLAAIYALALGREPAIATHLLVVAKTIALGDLALVTIYYPAIATALAIFALGRTSTMATNLLVVTRTKPGRPRFRIASLGPTNCAPLGFDNFAFHKANPRWRFTGHSP